MKIILLNGKVGAGKSFIGGKLHDRLDNSAFIEGDAFLQINPFAPTKKEYSLVAKSIANQIETYSKFNNIEYVIVSWAIWYEETLQILMDKTKKFEIVPIYLQSNYDVAEKRIRRGIARHTRHPDNLLKISLPVITDGFIFLSSNTTANKVVQEIIKIINN